MEKKNKLKKLLKIISKKLKTRYLLIFIVLLSCNSFAWFIYIKDVQNSIDIHVRGWNIIMENSSGVISQVYKMNVQNMYPGMDDHIETLTAYNKSEMSASLTYSILNVRILDETIYSKEGKLAENMELVGDELTSSELITKLSNDYPFKIEFLVSSEIIDAEYGSSTYTLKVSWLYESGNDELDTEWGVKAYQFKEDNPSTPSIELEAKINVIQNTV